MTKKKVEAAPEVVVKTHEQKVKDKKAAMANLTEEQLLEHMAKVEHIYRQSKLPNKLGNFDWDTEYDYYWNTYEDNGDAEKLQRRLSLGWCFATREDAVKSGLSSKNLSDQTLDGESCVEMSHKSSRAVLLKIPKSLRELNRKVKQRVQQNSTLIDVDGNMSTKTEKIVGNTVVEHVKEHTIKLE